MTYYVWSMTVFSVLKLKSFSLSLGIQVQIIIQV